MFVAAAAYAVPVISGALASSDKKKDKQRLDTNALAYSLAQGGNHDAFLFLKGMSGKFGPITIAPVPGVDQGGVISGWASSPARDDAYAKYKSLIPRYEPTAPVDPNAPGQVQDISNLGRTPDHAIAGAPTAEAGFGWILLAVIGFGVVAAVLSKKG